MPHAIISGVIFVSSIVITGAIALILRLQPEQTAIICGIAAIIAVIIIYLSVVWRRTDPIKVIGGVVGFGVGALLCKVALSDFLYSLGVPVV
jgi:hypothetical protein